MNTASQQEIAAVTSGTSVDFEVEPGVMKSQLSAAFDAVANPNDWKAPIDAWLDIKSPHLALVFKAIIFFTATNPRCVEADGQRIRIQAAGYRAGPAA